jgi:hypothetical protein
MSLQGKMQFVTGSVGRLPYEVFDLAISWAEMVIVQIGGNWLGIKTQVKRMELEK